MPCNLVARTSGLSVYLLPSEAGLALDKLATSLRYPSPVRGEGSSLKVQPTSGQHFQSFSKSTPPLQPPSFASIIS